MSELERQPVEENSVNYRNIPQYLRDESYLSEEGREALFGENSPYPEVMFGIGHYAQTAYLEKIEFETTVPMTDYPQKLQDAINVGQVRVEYGERNVIVLDNYVLFMDIIEQIKALGMQHVVHMDKVFEELIREEKE